jgi:hypothetical protein
MAVYLLVKTFITRWQPLLYSKHSSQNGGPSATENIQKEAVSLLLKPSQDGSISAIQNMHKMAVPVI